MKKSCILLVLLLSIAAGAVELPEKIVFAARQFGNNSHWYANFGHASKNPDSWYYGAHGQLCILDTQTGRVKTLLNDPAGTIRDPQVHYDGKKILFSWRKGESHRFHLYEINADGSGVRQLTDGDVDDIEPAYLPDGEIVFVSSRCHRYVNCMSSPVATVYRCDANGKNIRELSPNIEHDNTPWVMPDGRILYTRWEYIQRNQVSYHHLWAMNPDGTVQTVFYGNQFVGGVYIDAKPIPGTGKIVMVHCPGHGRKSHGGSISIVTAGLGPDDPAAEKVVSKPEVMKSGKKYENWHRDPYPLSEDAFLVAQGPNLLLMDGEGNTETIYSLPKNLVKAKVMLHEPRPLRPRKREPMPPSKVDPTQSTGRLVLLDVYEGRNMGGVKRGEIKKLLVLEALPKPVNFSGQPKPLTFSGSFSLERIIGTIPVEEDGSAYMELPANRALHFVALDENDLSVKWMQSFLAVAPGEMTTCIGCHEERGTAAMNTKRRVQSLGKAPRKPQPLEGFPEIFDFPRDIQPIVDKHCVSCHNYEKRKGQIVLTDDQGPYYSHSYFNLILHYQIADGRNLRMSNYRPREIGSSASPLMKKVDGSHHKVKVSDRERLMLQYWLDSGAQFAGTYTALDSGMVINLKTPNTIAAEKTMKKRCAECHSGKKTKLPRWPGDDFGEKEYIHLQGKQYAVAPPWVTETPLKKLPAEGPRAHSVEWVKKYVPSFWWYNQHRVYNLSRPGKSLQLLAPLAKEAGGYGICGEVFKSTDDPDYQKLLAAVEDGKKELEKIKRFNMPGFVPNENYIGLLKEYGVLAASHQPDGSISPYEYDRRYWESLWYKPKK